ncbi:MAG TPA: transglycosylase family protein [Gaiellaceae bacterium]
MKNLFVRLCVVVGAIAICLTTFVPATGASASSTRSAVINEVDALRRATWHWQRLMGKPRTPTDFAERRTRDDEFRGWVRDLWHRRALAAKRRAQNPPHRSDWLCIHRYERNPSQGWRTHTGNGYYGGLQMDISFQRAYGRELLRRKGTADRWTALEQMWVAERAYQSGRGFYPWPNTARYCGLI